MKTPEELKALKEEVETLNKKLADLTEEELTQVSGGAIKTIHTVMSCSNCYARAIWDGDLVGQTFYCSDCKHNTLTGIKLLF